MSRRLISDYSGVGCDTQGHVIRVVVAEAEPALRQEMCNLLNQHDDIVVAAQAEDSAEAVQCTRELAPDVVVLSMKIPGADGIEVVRQIVASQPGAGILVMVVPEDRPRVLESLRAGAVGYVPTAELSVALPVAVRQAAAGEVILDTDVLTEVMAALRRQGAPPARPAPPGVDPRDVETLELVAQGATNSTIALKMSCSQRTVVRRLSKIYRQLGVQNRYQAVAAAAARGWLQVT